ncbi:MAG: fluoride efflux transporter CrcB [Candidatus Omnitrophica bacterium]|nr:fluoride efflux transporter CrcB [Candidatus Omnitrophota bacterium]
MIKFINLVIGGTIGTIARYFLSGFIYRIFGTSFPYGTLVVNLTGCFIIGFLVSISENKFLLNPNARLLLMIGFCGAFTTFSTLILETNNLIKGGETLRAFMNVFVSVAVGFIVFRIGVLLGEVI